MNVLFIGGTGRLSKDSAALAAERGMHVTLLTRGSAERSIFFPSGCDSLQGDIRDTEGCRRLLEGKWFDVVVDFITFNTSQLEDTLDIVGPHCEQYVFISSATVYSVRNERELISEERTPVGNRAWEYAWNKYLCETRLAERHANGTAPQYTIVRPYVTYGNTRVPYPIVPFDSMKEWSFIERIRLGLPVPAFDKGGTLTTITHTKDFAKGMVGLFGNVKAYGEAFHITSDEEVVLADVIRCLESALHLEAHLVDVPREALYRRAPEYRQVIEGDKGETRRFDSSKIRKVVPGFSCDIALEDGIENTVAYLSNTPQLQKIDWRWMGQMDRLLLNPSEARNARALYGFASNGDRFKYMIGYHNSIENAARKVKKVIKRLGS